MGERLNQVARQADSVARLGGDEFLILLADLSLGADGSHYEAVRAAEEVAGRIREQFQQPFRLADTELTATASIGISIYPIDAMDAAALLRNADTAMFRSKDARKREVMPHLRPSARARESSSMDVRLRRAVEHDPWVLHYQPIVELSSGSIGCAEALIRWPQPDGSLIAPMQFIPLAEELGLIQRIGEWVIDEVCRQARAWQDQGLAIAISCNLSPRQLWNPGLADHMAGSLRREGVDPHSVIVEITESAAMADPIRTELALEALSDQGVTIAIDDFGTGYSSLSRLKRLHVSLLKTDRSFLSGIPQDAEAARLMTAIVQLARSLGLTPVAEGVEFDAQRQFLIAQGCPLAQGNLLGRPTEASELLAKHRLRIREADVQVSTLSS
jgi:EAL domain-containing protein (putative c-di-GMP-specific phosphodiesterase class I)